MGPSSVAAYGDYGIQLGKAERNCADLSRELTEVNLERSTPVNPEGSPPPQRSTVLAREVNHAAAQAV